MRFFSLSARGYTLFIEAGIILSVFVAASVWGTRYWYASLAAGRPPAFYQEYFEPAVMTACGKGFTVAASSVQAVADFLATKRDSFSCAEIPVGTALVAAQFQRPWLYLMLTVAATWRLLGISWSGLGPLAGLLFGLATASAYALFRVAMGRILSLGFTAAFAVSPVHLAQLPRLRDYSKAPFALACLFLLGLLCTRPLSTRSLIALSICYGAIVGIGYGFRADLLIDIIPFAVCLFALTPGALTSRLPVKAAAVGLSAAAFMITAWPIVSAGVRGGTCQGHFVLLGLTSGFTDNLDLVPAPYDWGQTYSDRWAASTVLSYAERRLPERRDIGYCSPEYDAASYSYLRQIVKTFPADIVTRSYASVLGIIKKTFNMETPLEHWATSLYSLRARVITRLTNTSLAWVCAAMFLAAAIELRLGLGLLGMVLFFGGYPAIQFSPRHDFHLEVITLFAMGFTLSCLWKCAQRPGAVTASATRRGLAFVVAAAIALPFTLLALRRVQDVRVRELFHAYLDAPKQPVPMAPAEPGALHPISFPGGQIYPAQFLQIEMHTANCGPAPAVVIRYEKRPDADLSRTIVLRREIDSHATTRVVAPVYEFFQGLEFSDERDGCVAGVSRVSELKDFPVLVNATLSPTWEGEPLHQRIAQLWP